MSSFPGSWSAIRLLSRFKIHLRSCAVSWAPRAYNAFGVFGTALQEKIGVFYSSSLKMVPKIPNAS
jgi:hypothetical protein